MSKNYLIPVLAFAVAAIGCSSGSSDATKGDAGKVGAAGSTAGTGGSTAGTGGSTAGAGGSTAGTGDGAAGSDAGAADPDAEVAGLANGVQAPACTVDVFSPQTFCAIFIAFCGTTTPGYTTQAECMTTYAAVGAATPMRQQCESYHLCNASWDTDDDRVLHCGHAAGGGGICDQTN